MKGINSDAATVHLYNLTRAGPPLFRSVPPAEWSASICLLFNNEKPRTIKFFVPIKFFSVEFNAAKII